MHTLVPPLGTSYSICVGVLTRPACRELMRRCNMVARDRSILGHRSAAIQAHPPQRVAILVTNQIPARSLWYLLKFWEPAADKPYRYGGARAQQRCAGSSVPWSPYRFPELPAPFPAISFTCLIQKRVRKGGRLADSRTVKSWSTRPWGNGVLSWSRCQPGHGEVHV